MNWLVDHRWSLVLPCWAVLVAGCSDDGAPQEDTSAETGATSSATADSATNVTTNGGTATSTSGTSGTSVNDGSSGGMTSGVGTTGGSDGTGTGGPPKMECESDEDCAVVDDCCTCGAKHVDDRDPACQIRECAQSACSEAGVSNPTAVCRFGTCELEPIPCNENEVLCDIPTPVCPDGFLPSVDPVENCWTQDCVPADICDVVPDCLYCAGHETCVEIQAMFATYYACEPIDPSCGGEASCDCMPGVCEAPNDTCNEGPNGLQCSCIAC